MIQHPKLKKIGGLRNFIQGSILKLLAVVLIASLGGYLGGHTVQKNYRNLTGYVPEGQIVIQTQEVEGDESGGVMERVQGYLETAKDKSTDLVYKAIDPPLRAMDWAAFWFSFVLCFMGTAWLTGKLVTIEKQVVNGGVDPTVIKNMKILEDKVKELVDNANKTNN